MCTNLCALFAPTQITCNFNIELFDEIPLGIRNLSAESLCSVKSESDETLCTICGKFCAVSSCRFPQCGTTYHLPCAEAAGLIEWHYFHSHSDLSDFAGQSV